MTRSRILVTGGYGFIGSAVIRQLIRQTSALVLNVDKLTYAATPAALEECARDPRYSHVRADICDGPEMSRIFAEFRPEAVIALAAESHVDRSIDGPAAFIQTNLLGTHTLLEAARAYWTELGEEDRGAFRFHHVSTDEVYGSLSESDPPFDETSPYRPNSPYAATKAGADHLVRAWGRTYGLPVIVTNCSNNYGPWQFPEKLIPTAIIAAFEGRPISVYGEGTNVRDWLHVEDHARALRIALERGRPGETYIVGGGAERRNIDVVRAICAEMDRARPFAAPHERLIEMVTDRPGHDHRYAVDGTKIARELGFRSSGSFEERLVDTVRWFLDHAEWWRAIRARVYGGDRLGLAAGRAT